MLKQPLPSSTRHLGKNSPFRLCDPDTKEYPLYKDNKPHVLYWNMELSPTQLLIKVAMDVAKHILVVNGSLQENEMKLTEPEGKIVRKADKHILAVCHFVHNDNELVVSTEAEETKTLLQKHWEEAWQIVLEGTPYATLQKSTRISKVRMTDEEQKPYTSGYGSRKRDQPMAIDANWTNYGTHHSSSSSSNSGQKGKGKGKSYSKGGAPYKTNLCSYWQEGRCNRGSSCTFAHGQEDMNY